MLGNAHHPEIEGRKRSRTTFSRLVAALVGVVVVLGGIVVAGGTASAVGGGTVTGATFEWTFSDEGNALAFNGQCNFWSAGESDGTIATYAASNGNATILKLNASDQYVPISDFATRCKDKNGADVNFLPLANINAKRLGQKVRFTNGTGTLDPATGASTIQWTGTWSINFYGDNVPFWMKDPKLTVNAAGNGTITASMGGFASDINDPEVKVPLTPVPNVVIATLNSVAGANTTGFTITPTYQNVIYDVDPEAGQSPQNRTNAGWGSWPTSMVDFQMQTGLGSYWYSSGTSIDARKPPQALTVGYGTFTANPAPDPDISVTPNTDRNPFVQNVFTVAGTGFTNFESSEAGVYVGFIAASKWQPGGVPNQADFIGTKFIPKALLGGGDLSTTVTVPAGTALDESETYGIGTICAHGCALSNREYDTFAPISFEVINDPALAKVGTGFSYTVPPFEGSIAPLTFAVAAGSLPLPDGLSLNANTGVISGTPTTESVVKVSIATTDSKAPRAKVVKKTITFKVAPASMVPSPEVLPPADQGITYTDLQLTVNGGTGPYKFKVTSEAKLPQGVRITGDGIVKGRTKLSGAFPITLTITDALKFTSTHVYNFVVTPADPMVVTPEELPGAQLNAAYPELQLTVDGGVAPYKFKRTVGVLPKGMTLSGTGLLKGTPKVTGTFAFTVTVTDWLKVTHDTVHVIEVT